MSQTGAVIAQSSVTISEYVYHSEELNFEFADSIKSKIVILPPGPLTLKMGDLHYSNAHGKNGSQTTISFKSEPGFGFTKAAGSALTTNDFKNSRWTSSENGLLRTGYYYMPALTSTNLTKDVNGYPSSLYQFENGSGVRYNVWISDSIPAAVNPGFFFPGKGGITKIEFTLKNAVWNLDLIGFTRKINVPMLEMETPSLSDSTKKLHPFFDAK